MDGKRLRITHVVTYASQDGAFGGPLAVAIEQTRELAALGHDVELVMGWDQQLDVSVPGVTVRLFRAHRGPGTGFSGLFSLRMQRYLRRSKRQRDVLHVHLGRDLVTAPVARSARSGAAALFIQTHGMVMPDHRVRATIFDRMYIRATLAKASSVLVLTPEEEQGITELTDRHALIDRITNGVSVSASPTADQGDRSQQGFEVLFLARLHPRKRVLFFAQAAAIVAQHLPTVRFSVVGPDEGDLTALRSFISANGLGGTLTYEGPVSPGEAPARIGRASVYVLPSVDEVAPMSVLEALAAGTPTIITRSNGLAPTLEKSDAAVVVRESPSDLADAIRRVLSSPELRAELSAAGRRVVESTFSATAVARRLERLYLERQ